MIGLKEFKKQYDNTIEELKSIYNVDHVVNYDQLALHSSFKRIGLDFHQFEKQGERIYTDGQTKILAIDFDFYHKHTKQNPFLSGYNSKSVEYRDKDECYDDCLNLILPIDDEQHKQMIEASESQEQEKREWKQFEEVKPKLYKSELGKQFEIGESIYWHFLEVLPPIYGKDCFYCPEPIRHTSEGKKVYHCLRKNNGKFTIEENIVK